MRAGLLAAGLGLLAPGLALSQDMSGMYMPGMYGPYSMKREASGTSWQPESTPHEAYQTMLGDWMTMVHGYADGVYDHQGGPRGGDKGFSASMLMVMATRPLAQGTAGLRVMLSLDPAMGPAGYPLLLQTGETADGQTPLVDRQHPHDFFMELAGSYSRPVGEDGSAFAYFGLPGEPALGPPAFMHRFSSQDNPEAPITHHWLDSTHVTFGVATLGGIWREWKLEGSAFRGREPDRFRWDIEPPGFDSFSARLSYNPSEDWSLQISYGRIVSPEQLDAGVSVGRLTASAAWNWRLAGSLGQTTFAFGQNRNVPGNTLDAFLLESALRVRETHTLFARAERVDKDELLASRIFTVNKLSVGYVYDFARWTHAQLGLGAMGSVDLIPMSLEPSYGSKSPLSGMLFARLKII